MKFRVLRFAVATAMLLAACVTLFACGAKPTPMPDVSVEPSVEPTTSQSDPLGSIDGDEPETPTSNPNEAPMPRPNTSAPPSDATGANGSGGASENGTSDVSDAEFLGEWHLIRGASEGWFYETGEPDETVSATLTLNADKTVAYHVEDSLLKSVDDYTGTWELDHSGVLPNAALWLLGEQGFEFVDGGFASWWIKISDISWNDSYAIYNGVDIELYTFYGEFESRETMWAPGVRWDQFRRELITPPPIAPILGDYVEGASDTVAVFTWFDPPEEVFIEQGPIRAQVVPSGEHSMVVIGVMNGLEVVVTRKSNLYSDDFGDRYLYDEAAVLWHREFNRNEVVSVELDSPVDDPYYICLRKINGHRRWHAFTLGDEDWDSHKIFSLHLYD